MIQQRLEATDGWMSPSGDFFPCYLNEYVHDGFYSAHGSTALAIIHEIYGDSDWHYRHEFEESQKFLIGQGWLRVDIESIIVNRATEYQKQSLEKMLKMKDAHDGFCRKCADKILSE